MRSDGNSFGHNLSQNCRLAPGDDEVREGRPEDGQDVESPPRNDARFVFWARLVALM